MGRCRVIGPNLLSGLTVAGETADTGYANANLTDDVVAKAWRSSAAASSFVPYIDMTASFVPLSWVGVFDLATVTTTEKIKQVIVSDSPDNVSYTERGRFTVNSRGDGGMLVDVIRRYLRLAITTTGSTKIDCGLFFGGRVNDLPKTFTQRQQSRDRGVVVNDTEGGGTYAGRLRSYREVIALNWAALTDEQHQALAVLEDDVGGQYAPFVMIPNASVPDELYHGRLEDVQTWTQRPGAWYEGHALAFRESGRAL